jgi:outer membrane receptor protein involved in Fe transport
MKNLLLNIIVFILLCSLFNLPQAATTGKITGIVQDAKTGEPLPGVNVVVEGTFLGAATDLEGFYAILNVPPGNYSISFSMVGYATQKFTEVRVNIDQTTNLSAKLEEEALELGEAITVVASRPVVEKDVAASRANISTEEIKALPVVNVSSVVGLQAGIEGLSIRGGNVNEVAFVLDGLTLRDERNNTPYTGISLTSVEELQVQAGGFNAEYGNIRSGIINAVTKEGSTDKYSVSFLGTYKPESAKHFGMSPNSPNSYWIRPFLDNNVAWTGTMNGAWDMFTQRQYPEFKGWNTISEETLQNDNPDDDLTPTAAQQLFLFQHRRQLDIQVPDYTADGSFGGPVPGIGHRLGNLRFFTSYRQTQSAYLIPLHFNSYNTYTWQMKLTSDVGQGKKLMVTGLLGNERGVDQYNNGTPGIFTSSSEIGSALSNGPKYIDARMFNTDYWGPAKTDYVSFGFKWTQVLSNRTFYEASFNLFRSKYNKGTGAFRDNALLYRFGNNYYVDEAPFGFEPASVTGIDGMRMGAGMSNARDSSVVTAYQFNANFNTQLNRRNNIKFGGDFVLTRSKVNYANYDEYLPRGNTQSKWDETPLRGALYLQDKIEYEGMIATLGLRMDYSHAGGQWYDFSSNPYSIAFSGTYVGGIDTLLQKSSTKHIFTFSPRLAIAFPVTVNSKLYFNYGHFRQMPIPDDLYLIRKAGYTGQISRIGDPNIQPQKTVAYELGYEHSLFNLFLVRIAGYYKDITLQPQLVTYENFDGTVSYSKAEPTNYEDIRGFEITLKKNRGTWIRGFINYTYMVSTYGYFGFGDYYENPAEQRQYERETTYYYQTKPKPRPYARANIDFTSPRGFGPEFVGINPLSDWRINFLANWKAGRFTTWVGGGSIPGVFANVQWTDYWNVDMRIGKNFRFGNFGNVELFVDINNLFNYKYMTDYGFVDSNDRTQYFKSLHLPSTTEALDQFGYVNIPGDDRPGDYRSAGAEFTPIVVIGSTDDTDRSERYLYYDAQKEQYYWWNSTSQSFFQDSNHTQKVLDSKAYIDMPNLDFFTFLNPRNFFWGIRFSIDL